MELKIWLAWNEEGDWHFDTDSAEDAVQELIENCGGTLFSVVEMTVTVPELTVHQVAVDVPETAIEVTTRVDD